MADEIDIRQGDALFQIAEPDKPTRTRNAGQGIGIDLGTTHSLVAFAPSGAEPVVLRFEDVPEGSPESRGILPSVVTFEGGQPLVGSVAIERASSDPSGVFSSAKRFVGRGLPEIDFEHPYRLSDEDGVLRFVTDEGARSPVEISAAILRRLKERAEAELGGPVDGAVITVPAYFDDAQRQATKDAARVAGLNVYRLLAEPTAAALAYGLQESGQGLFAIYDLGGGTFDISILRLADGVFQVLATGGDSALGGDDFDRALARLLAERAGLDGTTSQQHVALVAAARRAKEALSDLESVSVTVPEVSLDTTVSRAEFNAAIEGLVERTATACLRTAKDAGLRVKELDAVVLVGGSTRVPLVREIVAETFRTEPKTELDPDRVVAHGAAIQADVLSGSARAGFTLLDVVPLSLGLETMGGIVEKIIPRNATIPIAARQVFTNYSEKQTGMAIHVVQGERELVDDCKSLARFELTGIPRLPPSMARVEITFELDADALLTVTARELMTGVRQQVQVKPTHGLTDEEVDGMVMASLDHAGEDFAARDLAEARVEFGRVSLAVRTAIAEVGHVEALLDDAQRTAIEQALAAGDEVMADPAADAKAVNRAREAIEAASTEFAQRRMERALRAGMSGKTLDQVESALEDEDKLAPRRGAHEAERID